MTEQEIEQLLNILKIDIVDERNLQLEKFSQVVLDDDNVLLGHNDTHCYRCVTNAIPDFNDAINNSNYITCVSNLAGEELTEKVGVYYKSTTRAESILECVSSKLMAYMGAPTCFNFLVEGVILDETLEVFRLLKTASVDFISYGEKFYSLSDIYCNFATFGAKEFVSINDILQLLSDAMIDNFSLKKNGSTKKMIGELQESFVKTWLVRRLLLGDFDFNQANCGVLYNEEKGTCKFVNFDYELCGKKINHAKLMDAHISTCAKLYPKVYEEYIEKLRKLRSVELMALRNASGMHYNFLTTIFNNAREILNYHEKYIVDFPEV